MNPVYQTIFGKGEGNCFPACIASILECDIEEIPNFCSESDEDQGRSWLDKAAAWLRSQGRGLLYHKWVEGQPVPLIYPGTFVILSGRSSRALPGDADFMHAVVAEPHLGERTEFENEDGSKSWTYRDYCFRYVHDPHPSSDFIHGDPVDLMVILK